MAIYFIQAGDSGPVKIGFASDVFSRLRKMQADNHERLTVVALFVGGYDEESALHDAFAHLRVHGEWFRPCVLASLGEITLPHLPITREQKVRACAGSLRRWIADEGLTQREAAKRLNVHEITLCRWVNGKAIPQREQMDGLRAIGILPASFSPPQEVA